jgi:glyoxylase-like metal-dependent hydrolase (beta-lactamase superfamily II)
VEARVERVSAPEVAGQESQAVGAECNAWLVGDDDEVIVIDPGEHAAAVLEAAGEREIIAVICTHGHARHVAAAVEVAQRDEAPVALHRSDLLFWRMAHDDVVPEIEMAAGGRFDVSDVALEVIHTPGHTPGSVSLYCEDLGIVFTGDTLAAIGPVPHDGEYPDFARQLTAIVEQPLDLPSATRVAPGHGEETTIGDAAKRFDGWVTAGPAIADLLWSSSGSRACRDGSTRARRPACRPGRTARAATG